MVASSAPLLLLLTLIHPLLCISAHDFLLPGSSLSVDGELHSPGGTFTCGFQQISPNASTFSIWFSKSTQKTVVWSANPLHPVYSWGSKVEFNSDGGMILKDYSGQTVWTNDVSSSDAQRAQLLDSGNLVVKGKGGITLWQSFDSPTDTLLPTQSFTAAIKLVSTNRLLVPGHFSFHFDDQYLLTLFDDEKDISFIYWPEPRANIWQKHRIPSNSTRNGILDSWGHFHGSDNLTFTAADWGPNISRRLTLDYDGNLRLYSLDMTGNWSVTWMVFPQLCKVRGLCGRNGICVYTPAPACVCAPGYDVIDPSDRSKGCSPRVNISCHGQVEFISLRHTDFLGYDLSVHHSVSVNSCMEICSSDCNCVGFAYWEGLGDCYPKNVLLGGVAISNLFSTGTMYTYRELVLATRKFKDELGRGASELQKNEDDDVKMALGRVIRVLAEQLKSDDSDQSWIADFIDTRLHGQFNNTQARMTMELAVSCLEEDRGRRPTMEYVVQMLVSVDEVNQTVVG
ncbi:hypothetical protein ABZP36_021941 [Zizania latifolia]